MNTKEEDRSQGRETTVGWDGMGSGGMGLGCGGETRTGVREGLGVGGTRPFSASL